MAQLDKKAKYNEFSVVDGKHCIGGYEILRAWHGIDTNWKWYATKIITKNKKPNIYEGFVEGFESEWGSWYAQDMENPMIEVVPIESLGNMAEFATS